MANTTAIKVVADGHRNAVVEMTGILDTAAASLVVAPAIQLSDFTNNDPLKVLLGFAVGKLNYSISDSITAFLFWQATAQQTIAPVFGRGKLCFEDDGWLRPDSSAAGFNGAINLELYNIAPAAGTKQGYTILLEMIKLYTT